MKGLQLRSLVKSSGELELSLATVDTPPPGTNEVLVQIEAAPLNPSDLGLLFAFSDMSTAVASGPVNEPLIQVRVPAKAMLALAPRLDMSMPVGNEGAGLVIATGDSPQARALLGRRVATLGGAMYSQYRCVSADQCLLLNEGASAAEGASAFVNPLTSIGILETMKSEGHSALVNTAAASNLGQMLLRLCQKDGVALVNIVRNSEQVTLLRNLGAQYVCSTDSPTFLEELTQAIEATGATIGFDATGGGRLAGQILSCMEAAINRSAKEYSRYGSSIMKQVYIYGGLDDSPIQINRDFGSAWKVGGWLLIPFMQKLGRAGVQALKARVADELNTTFKSHYAGELSLAEALKPENIARYSQPSTGGKFLISPNKGLV